MGYQGVTMVARGPDTAGFITLKGEYSGIEYAMIDDYQRGFPRIRGSQCD